MEMWQCGFCGDEEVDCFDVDCVVLVVVCYVDDMVLVYEWFCCLDDCMYVFMCVDCCCECGIDLCWIGYVYVVCGGCDVFVVNIVCYVFGDVGFVVVIDCDWYIGVCEFECDVLFDVVVVIEYEYCVCWKFVVVYVFILFRVVVFLFRLLFWLLCVVDILVFCWLCLLVIV